jgi:hypothetical protein
MGPPFNDLCLNTDPRIAVKVAKLAGCLTGVAAYRIIATNNLTHNELGKLSYEFT